MSQNKQVQASFGVGSDYESECWNEHCNDLKVGCSTGERTWEKTWRKAQEPLLAEIARLSGHGVLQHTAYIDDIAAIAHGEGYDAGAGCSRSNTTEVWDNFKQLSLPILKQMMPVHGYVQVPVEKLKAAHLNAKIAEETLYRGYQEMNGMKCGFTDTACTHAGIAKNELEEMLAKAQEHGHD